MSARYSTSSRHRQFYIRRNGKWDAQGRVLATIADYQFAYPIFSKIMAQSSGKNVPDNVREVVKLIAERAGSAATRPFKVSFSAPPRLALARKLSSPASRSASRRDWQIGRLPGRDRRPRFGVFDQQRNPARQAFQAHSQTGCR
jgi:hypothetical protein